jgi:menaquinol-cytochrome c reductase cytochrome b/c subunit
VELPGGGRIPAHLLQRSRDRRIALGLEVPGAPAGGGGAGAEVPAAAGPARAAAATATVPAPTVTGPGGHTQRLLTVVKSGSIQETRAEAQDKVHTWPHLLVVEFAALLIFTAGVIIFSALVRAPLLQLADFNKTPNPSKAPWYFLGLQELLTMFHPMVAGVTIPGMGLFLLIVAPFVDKNPSREPRDRKFAIAIFTIFVMLWAVLVIIGSFFRGPGFNFVFPWNDGVFFDL